MRSIFAITSCLIFAFGAGISVDPAGEGDGAPLSVYFLFRVLFIGLAVLSLAAVEWDRVAQRLRAEFENAD